MNRCVALVAALALVLGIAAPVMAADPAEIPLVIEKNRFEPDVIPEELDMAQPRIEKIIPGGKTVRLKMPALKPGKYPFVGEYHSETAKATIVAE